MSATLNIRITSDDLAFCDGDTALLNIVIGEIEEAASAKGWDVEITKDLRTGGMPTDVRLTSEAGEDLTYDGGARDVVAAAWGRALGC